MMTPVGKGYGIPCQSAVSAGQATNAPQSLAGDR